jgi:hypothetical protein
MHAVKTFGRPASLNTPRPSTLGAPSSQPPAPTAVPSCEFSSYLGDAPDASSMTHGTKTALVGAALVGVGWLVGGIVPVVGRAIGSLVGAGVAGAVTYAGYSSWQTDGGTTHQPGACGAK